MKMKVLKKINKGLILTIIVVVVLVIYLIGVEKQRDSDKTEIKNTCQEFLEFIDRYTVLPEENQTPSLGVTKEVQEKAEKELRTELEKRMIKNDDAVDIQYDYLLSTLKTGYLSNEIKSKSKHTIDKITNYEFDGNQVTVTLNTTSETTYKYIDEETGKEMEKQNTTSNTGETIILQKVDKQWKVVYSMLDDGTILNYTETLNVL